MSSAKNLASKATPQWPSLEHSWPSWRHSTEARKLSRMWALAPENVSDEHLALALQRSCAVFLQMSQNDQEPADVIPMLCLALAERGWTLAQMPWDAPRWGFIKSLGALVESVDKKSMKRLMALGAVDFDQWHASHLLEPCESLGGARPKTMEEAAFSLAARAGSGDYQGFVAVKLATFIKLDSRQVERVERGARRGFEWAASRAGSAGENYRGKREQSSLALVKMLGLDPSMVEQAVQTCDQAADFAKNTRPWLRAMLRCIEDEASAPLRALLKAAQLECPSALRSALPVDEPLTPSLNGAPERSASSTSAQAPRQRGLVEAAIDARSLSSLEALLDAGVPTLADWFNPNSKNLLARWRKVAEGLGDEGRASFERLAWAAWDEMRDEGLEAALAGKRLEALAGAGAGRGAAKAAGEALMMALDLKVRGWVKMAEGASPSVAPRGLRRRI